MSDAPITPKANKRVLDGEVVEEDAHSYFAEKQADIQTETEQTKTEKPAPSADKKPDYLTLGVAGLALLLSLIALFANDQDRQVERVNQLQSQLEALLLEREMVKTNHDQALAKLQSQVAALEEDSRKSVKWISQSEFENSLNSVQSELADKLRELQTLFAEQDTPTESPSDAPAGESETDEKPSPQIDLSQFLTQQQADELRHAWQSGLNLLQNQLSDLAQQNQFLVENQESLAEQTGKQMQALTPMQISQWVVAVNTQWLLMGNVEQSKQKLLSLEQAIALSELENAPRLLRLLGEDLAMLDNHVSAAEQSHWVQNLKQQLIQQKHIPQKASRETTAPTLSMEAQSSQSAWDKLWDKLASIFVIRKRESEQDVSQVESLLLSDVLQQRGLLLIDRIEWALQTQSQKILASSIEDFSVFIAATYPQASAQFDEALAPLKAYRFEQRQNLKLLGAW